MAEERVACRTPAEGRNGVTNIPVWKVEAIRAAILAVLAERDIHWKDLTAAVGECLSEDQLSRMGNLGWHVVTVKLELEVRGEISRVEGAKPQLLTRNVRVT